MGKTVSLTIQIFVNKVMSLLCNMLSSFVITVLPRSNHLLISWQQSLSTVILEPKKIKYVTTSTFSPSICHEVMGSDAMILVFWMLSFNLAVPLSSFTLIKSFLVPLHFLPLEWYLLHIWDCWYFYQKSWFQILIHPAWNFAWWTLHTGCNTQPCHTPFPILNQLVVPCPVLTVASWLTGFSGGR